MFLTFQDVNFWRDHPVKVGSATIKLPLIFIFQPSTTPGRSGGSSPMRVTPAKSSPGPPSQLHVMPLFSVSSMDTPTTTTATDDDDESGGCPRSSATAIYSLLETRCHRLLRHCIEREALDEKWLDLLWPILLVGYRLID